MDNKKYVGGKEASDILGVHQRTLYQWEEKGWINTIRTPGGKRLYDVTTFIEEKCGDECEKNLNKVEELKGKLNISYVRVSSQKQKDDLIRQKRIIKEKYPDHIMIEDIGSGVDFNKRGIRKIIKLAIEGKIKELVIAYKDRLMRFGYELIEDLIKDYSGGKITIMIKKDDLEPEEELAYDVLQVMDVFTTKMNGLKKYKKKQDKKNKNTDDVQEAKEELVEE